MEKEEYYKIGEEKGLPVRCPILSYCSRRAWTIYLFSEYSKYSPNRNMLQALREDGTLPSDYEEKEIMLQGEAPSIWRGKIGFNFDDVCPEVNLFDSYNALMPGVACTSADYDKDRKINKKRVLKTQHFSRCAEFNKYLFDNNRIQKVTKSRNGNSEDISNKVIQITEMLTKLGYGQEVIFNELDEIKDLYTKLNKKNWAELVKGKLIELGLSEVINKEVISKMYEILIEEKLRIIK